MAALRLDGMTAPFVVAGSVNTAVFEAYLQPRLAPSRRVGDSVLIDPLSGHTLQSVRQLIQARGASVLFLPPYSPDLSPLENAFSKLNRSCAGLKHSPLRRCCMPFLKPCQLLTLPVQNGHRVKPETDVRTAQG